MSLVLRKLQALQIPKYIPLYLLVSERNQQLQSLKAVQIHEILQNCLTRCHLLRNAQRERNCLTYLFVINLLCLVIQLNRAIRQQRLRLLVKRNQNLHEPLHELLYYPAVLLVAVLGELLERLLSGKAENLVALDEVLLGPEHPGLVVRSL